MVLGTGDLRRLPSGNPFLVGTVQEKTGSGSPEVPIVEVVVRVRRR